MSARVWRVLRWLTWRLHLPVRVTLYDAQPYVMWYWFATHRLWPSQAVVDARYAWRDAEDAE